MKFFKPMDNFVIMKSSLGLYSCIYRVILLIEGQPIISIPPPTVVTPVLSSSVINATAPLQAPLINAQEVLRKAQEDAKVYHYFSMD